ncbi:MAG: glycosyltransferase family 4 protein [Pirellulales bacterium]
MTNPEKNVSNTVLSVFGLSPRRVGGTEVYARELSLQLLAKGWSSVLCFSENPTPEVEEYLKSRQTHIEVIPGIDKVNWTTFRALYALVGKYCPRILHIHYIPMLSPLPWLTRISTAQRIFYTEHTSHPENSKPRQAPRWKQAVARSLAPWDGVFCGSQYGHSYLATQGYVPQKKIHTVYNSVANPDAPSDSQIEGQFQKAAEFRKNHGISKDALLIVQVGQLADYKGVEDLVRAFALVHQELNSSHLALVGDGPLAAPLQESILQLGLKDAITLTGLVSNPISMGVYDAADICCQVSRWEELFGFTIAEAMVCQRPVVATRVGGIPELINDGTTGFLVPHRDARQIADHILKLAKSPTLRAKMGVSARKMVAEKFDVGKNVRRLIELYGIVG